MRLRANTIALLAQAMPVSHALSLSLSTTCIDCPVRPVNWETFAPSFAKQWVQSHVVECRKLNMPCVLGEFGHALGADEGEAAAIASELYAFHSLLAPHSDAAAAATHALPYCVSQKNCCAQQALSKLACIRQIENKWMALCLAAGTRDPYFAATFQAVEAAVKKAQPIAGDMFWQWVGTAGQQNGILSTDSTFTDYIEPHAKFMQTRSGAKIC